MPKQQQFEIKIPRGTVIKCFKCPVQLKTSLRLVLTEEQFKLEDHKILEWREDDEFTNSES